VVDFSILCNLIRADANFSVMPGSNELDLIVQAIHGPECSSDRGWDASSRTEKMADILAAEPHRAAAEARTLPAGRPRRVCGITLVHTCERWPADSQLLH
jgi:hypothetical protein